MGFRTELVQDKDSLDLIALKDYVTRAGSSILTGDELRVLFDSVKLQEDDCVTEQQFLQVFAKTTGDLKDAEFRLFIEDLVT